MDVNKIMILGNVGQDPESRTFQNGGKICTFSVATNESWKDKQSGEKKTRTTWHRCVCKQEGLVRVAEEYVSKGKRVWVEGRLDIRKYTDQAGVEKYATEIVVERLGLEGGGRDKDDASDKDDPNAYAEARYEQQHATKPSNRGDLDDDIPF